jgi:cyclopropane-fatty-acyl-phospholipid synthase
MKMPAAEKYVTDLLASADIKLNGKRPGDITVNDKRFYGRVMAGGTLAIGESYMDGWWDCDDLGEFVRKVFVSGLKAPIDLRAAKIYLSSALGNLQTVRGSKRVANVHYNLPSEMYMLFLGPLNQYTSFYYAHTRSDTAAEKARLDLICRKLKLSKHDKVLDIGCGWGGFAKYAAENYGCQVTGVSISKEQIAYAKKSVKGLPVKFLLQDYRHLTGSYTKIFSGGMLEHVGYKNYKIYMKKVAGLLTPDGLAVIDFIGGNRPIKGPDPWVGKYIFPNSMVPSPSQISSAFEDFLVLEDWHNFRYDYARTADFWVKKFRANWSNIQKLNPELFDERFYRMWVYYLEIFKGAFLASHIQQWQLVLAKPHNGAAYLSER